MTAPPFIPLAARILLSIIFLMSGAGKIFHWNAMAGMMVQHGMPAPEVFLIGAIVVELLGGLSILTGFKAQWGAAILFLYLIPTTLIFHNFWAVQGEAQQSQLVNFLKNIAIMGGLLMVVAHGSGPFSVDQRSGRI